MTQKNVIKISDDIIKKADRCKKNLICLSGESDLCKVEYYVDDKIHFVKCVNIKPCSYRIPFGYSCVCICPVRKEIFNRYRI